MQNEEKMHLAEENHVLHRMLTHIQTWFDRLLAERSARQLIVLFFFVLVVFLMLKFLAPDFVEQEETEEEANWMKIMSMFLDAGCIDGVKGVNYLFALIIALTGSTLFSGLFISVLTNVFDTHNQRYHDGQLFYRWMEGHVLLIGYDRMVPSVVAKICSNHRYDGCYILVQTMSDADVVRDEIRAKLKEKDYHRLLIYGGSNNDLDDLQNLRSWKARELFIFGEHEQADRDSMNLSCLQKLVSIHESQLKRDIKKIGATVFFVSQSTYRAFQVTDLFGKVRDYFNFKPQNFYETWAQKLLVTRNFVEDGHEAFYPPLDRELVGVDSQKYVHLVIIGMGRMGTALGTMAAHVLHFPNVLRDSSLRTRITFISLDAKQGRDFYCGHYRHFFDISPEVYLDYEEGELDIATESYLKHPEKFSESEEHNFLDIEFRFVRGRVESPAIQKLLQCWAEDSAHQLLTVAICLHKPEENMGTALYLPDAVFDNEIPVFVRLENSGTLLSMLESEGRNKGGYSRYRHLYPFGMLSDAYTEQDEIVRRGQLFNHLYDMVVEGKPSPTEEVLSSSWQNLKTSLQWSSLYCAYSVPFRLRAIGRAEDDDTLLTDEEMSILGKVEHNRWVTEKLLLGFRPPKGDEMQQMDRQTLKERYIHQCIVPYKDLSEADKQKDLQLMRGIPLVIRAKRDARWEEMLSDILKSNEKNG